MQNIIRIFAFIFIGLLMSCKPDQKINPESVELPIHETVVYPDWVTQEYVTGHFTPLEHPDFIVVDQQYADRSDRILHRKTYEAFQKMHAAALAAGHQLQIRSATRNFDYQKGIWTRKWTGATLLEGGINAAEIEDPVERARKILLYSSMPGTSRHHWGTDIDLNSFENDYFKSGKGLAMYKWLLENAATYGFCQPYTEKTDGRTGYEEERWHWTYMPLAKVLTAYCKENLKNEMIQGFDGSQVAGTVDMLQNYILGINSNCL